MNQSACPHGCPTPVGCLACAADYEMERPEMAALIRRVIRKNLKALKALAKL